MNYMDKVRGKMLEVRSILEDIYYNGKMHGLSIYDAAILKDCYNELCKPGHSTETFNSKVAKIFEKKKFSVVLDDDGINYIICI